VLVVDGFPAADSAERIERRMIASALASASSFFASAASLAASAASLAASARSRASASA